MKNIFLLLIPIFLTNILSAQETGSYTDSRDGNVYKTVKIGNHWWFAENLRFKTENSWAYNDDEANVQKYGRLYMFEAANTACPTGWHLAKGVDWSSLGTEDDEKILGGKLKAVEDWEAPNKGADNALKFEALPAGYKKPDGTYTDKGKICGFWAGDEDSSNTAWRIYLLYDNAGIMRGMDLKTYGFSVRCVKD